LPQNQIRFLTQSYRFAADVVADSSSLQTVLTIACLAGLLWLNAGYLMHRLDASLPAGAPLSAFSLSQVVPSLDRHYATPADLGLDRIGGPPVLPAGVAVLSGDTARQVDLTEPAEEAPVSIPVEQVIQIQKGDTLMAVLVDSGVDIAEARSAVDALATAFPPRDLKAGQEITLNLEVPTAPIVDRVALTGLSLQPSVESQIALTRGLDGSFVVDAVARPLSVVPSLARGTISFSLFGAGAASGVPPQVMSEVIRAFSYDVDFQRDLRPGDGFEVVYERIEVEEGALVRTGDVLFAALTLSGKALELYGHRPEGGQAGFYNAKGESTRKALLRTPIDGARVSSGFGMRKHPILGYSKMHQGVDLAAPTGTPIFAAGDGTIAKIGRNGTYGKYIRIRHGEAYSTAYGHVSRFAKGLKSGSRVRQGQVIAYVGSTGRSTGPHLHYEVLKGGKQVNPVKVKFPIGEILKGKALHAFEAKKTAVDRLRAELRSRLPLVTASADAGDTACPASDRLLPC